MDDTIFALNIKVHDVNAYCKSWYDNDLLRELIDNLLFEEARYKLRPVQVVHYTYLH